MAVIHVNEGRRIPAANEGGTAWLKAVRPLQKLQGTNGFFHFILI
ncbi:hypothetical protein [Bhargavaea changchunensis]